jgi:hypothetical protein
MRLCDLNDRVGECVGAARVFAFGDASLLLLAIGLGWHEDRTARESGNRGKVRSEKRRSL